MNKLFFTVMFCCFCLSSMRAQVYALPGITNETPIRFFKQKDQTWLATSHHLFAFERKGWQLRWTSKDSIVTVTSVNRLIWVGTPNRLRALDFKHQGDPVIFDRVLEVTALAQGAQATDLLVGTTDKVLLFKDTVLVKTLLSKTWVNDLCNCGAYTWVGTSIGLTALMPDGKLQQYAEEGVKGFEIPDNIVEHLICVSKRKILTITMPVALAFFDLNQASLPSHPDHFDYLGERDNNVLDAAEAADGSIVFATTLGGVLRVKLATQAHEHELAQHTKAERLRPEQQFPGEGLEKITWERVFVDGKKRLWLAGSGRVVRLKGKLK
jgi:hypothetical protein